MKFLKYYLVIICLSFTSINAMSIFFQAKHDDTFINHDKKECEMIKNHFTSAKQLEQEGSLTKVLKKIREKNNQITSCLTMLEIKDISYNFITEINEYNASIQNNGKFDITLMMHQQPFNKKLLIFNNETNGIQEIHNILGNKQAQEKIRTKFAQQAAQHFKCLKESENVLLSPLIEDALKEVVIMHNIVHFDQDLAGF
ncbi:MAG: hypothetical protein WA432_00250 [Candidatus Babeliaceae bacterium]